MNILKKTVELVEKKPLIAGAATVLTGLVAVPLIYGAGKMMEQNNKNKDDIKIIPVVNLDEFEEVEGEEA